MIQQNTFRKLAQEPLTQSTRDQSVPDQPTNTLIRTIGRWSLTALIINSIIGSGIFGLPSVVSGRLGRLAPIAYLIAGAGMAIIAGCLSEVASQFRETGGPYLYARETLRPFWRIQISWMTWLSRIAAGSGTANLFTTYLGQIFPRASQSVYRMAILTLLVGVLAVANYIGVKSGARVSDFFTGTKILLLAIFIGAGLWWIGAHGAVTPASLPHAIGANDWLEAVLVLVYAYGGFEAVLLATGEMRNPRRDAPVALMVGIASVAVIYTLVQVVVSGTLPDPLPPSGYRGFRRRILGPRRCGWRRNWRARVDLQLSERQHSTPATGPHWLRAETSRNLARTTSDFTRHACRSSSAVLLAFTLAGNSLEHRRCHIIACLPTA